MARIARFYKHESCGQCTPCREGSGWMWRMLERMAKGEASKDEIKKRNNFDPIVKENKNIPYLVDQHLLDKNA